MWRYLSVLLLICFTGCGEANMVGTVTRIETVLIDGREVNIVTIDNDNGNGNGNEGEVFCDPDNLVSKENQRYSVTWDNGMPTRNGFKRIWSATQTNAVEVKSKADYLKAQRSPPSIALPKGETVKLKKEL